MKTQTTCRCCGQQIPDGGTVLVSLESNALTYKGQQVRLTTRLADLASILAEHMPNFVANERVIQRMWGQQASEWANTNMKVAVCQLRARVRPLGLDVVNSFGVGYALVPIVDNREQAQATTQQEQVAA